MKMIRAGEFEAEVLQHPGVVLVDFFTEDCAACWRLAPLHQEAAAKGNLHLVGVDAGADLELTARCQVQTVPTLLLFRGGQCLGQRGTAKSVGELQRWVAEVTGE